MAKRHGARLIEINLDETALTDIAMWWCGLGAGEAPPATSSSSFTRGGRTQRRVSFPAFHHNFNCFRPPLEVRRHVMKNAVMPVRRASRQTDKASRMTAALIQVLPAPRGASPLGQPGGLVGAILETRRHVSAGSTWPGGQRR
ncbi:MAG: hypothetical protein IPG47_17100 [Thermoflexaceae bacterium]|nr:hypothetical protein [Thermoflexaceae bacterium]